MAQGAAGRDCEIECAPASHAPRLLHAAELPGEIEPAVLQRQFDALSAMSIDNLRYSPRGPVRVVRGKTGLLVPFDIPGRQECTVADDVLALLAPLLLARGTESLSLVRNFSVLPGRRSLRFQESIRGIPVIPGFVAVDFDESTRAVTAVVADFVPDRGLPQEPRYSASEAGRILPEVMSAGRSYGPSSVQLDGDPFLGYFASRQVDEPKLVWVIWASVNGESQWIYLNAMTGLVVATSPQDLFTFQNGSSQSCEPTR
jgi:hypothetical protein